MFSACKSVRLCLETCSTETKTCEDCCLLVYAYMGVTLRSDKCNNFYSIEYFQVL